MFWNTPSDDALQDIEKIISVFLDTMGVGISAATMAELVSIKDGDTEGRTAAWDELLAYTELLERMHQQQEDTTSKWTQMRKTSNKV